MFFYYFPSARRAQKIVAVSSELNSEVYHCFVLFYFVLFCFYFCFCFFQGSIIALLLLLLLFSGYMFIDNLPQPCFYQISRKRCNTKNIINK